MSEPFTSWCLYSKHFTNTEVPSGPTKDGHAEDITPIHGYQVLEAKLFQSGFMRSSVVSWMVLSVVSCCD